MALTASDFKTFVDFQNQAETYRYGLAQKMNKLQIDKISNNSPGETAKPLAISRSNWAQQPDFNYRFSHLGTILKSELLALASLLCWLTLVIIMIQCTARWVKTIPNQN